MVSRVLMFDTPERNILKALFENFYPCAIIPNHNYGYNSDIEFFGYSPFFDVCEEAFISPKYEFKFKIEVAENGDEIISIESVEKH